MAARLVWQLENTYLSAASQMQKKHILIKKARAEKPSSRIRGVNRRLHEAKGLSRKTAHTEVIRELTAVTLLRRTWPWEFQLDEEDVVNPMHAAVASFIIHCWRPIRSWLCYQLQPVNVFQQPLLVFLALLLHRLR